MNFNSDNNEDKKFLSFILERFQIERKRFDRSGIYVFTQRMLAYNSNKIEGSTLTEEQQPLYLTQVLYLNQKIIIDLKMLKK